MAFVLRLEAGVRVTEAAVAVRLKLDGFEQMATELCGLVWAASAMVAMTRLRIRSSVVQTRGRRGDQGRRKPS